MLANCFSQRLPTLYVLGAPDHNCLGVFVSRAHCMSCFVSVQVHVPQILCLTGKLTQTTTMDTDEPGRDDTQADKASAKKRLDALKRV